MTQEMTKEKNSNHKPSAHYALCHHTYMYTCLELPTLNTPLFPPNYKHSNTKLHALVWNEHDFIFGVGTAGLKLSTSWTCAYNILTFSQIKGVTMATSCHVASPWHLAHWTLMENEWTYLSKRLTMNQDAGEQGQAKAKRQSYKGTQRKPEGQNCPAVPHNTCPRGSSTGQPQISQFIMMVDEIFVNISQVNIEIYSILKSHSR